MKILIVDNYDSFTYNLFHYVQQFSDIVTVIRNNEIHFSEVKSFDKIILSPGFGLPSEHKNLIALIQQFATTKSILGVCLGHQAIVESFGGSLINLNEVMHGISTNLLIQDSTTIFRKIPRKIKVGHYHSWVADEKSLPDCLMITSKNETGLIMSVRHKSLAIEGVQFHPESVMTEYGLQMIKNWCLA